MSEPGVVDRNRLLEEYLTNIAAEGAGYRLVDALPNGLIGDTGGLDRFADARALPGPVRMAGRDFDLEVAEELADARNYLVWAIGQVYESVRAGGEEQVRGSGPSAGARYSRWMRALSAIVVAWHELHTDVI